MNERIQLILKTQNISASKFADEIGVQRSRISHIISGRNNPSLDFIQKIIKRFPDISSDWLVFGKGSMYKEQDLFSTSEASKTENKQQTPEIKASQSDINIDKPAELAENKEKTSEFDAPEIKSQPLKKTKTIAGYENSIRKTLSSEISDKRIERIVIFYSDRTCTEYKLDQ